MVYLQHCVETLWVYHVVLHLGHEVGCTVLYFSFDGAAVENSTISLIFKLKNLQVIYIVNNSKGYSWIRYHHHHIIPSIDVQVKAIETVEIEVLVGRTSLRGVLVHGVGPGCSVEDPSVVLLD